MNCEISKVRGWWWVEVNGHFLPEDYESREEALENLVAYLNTILDRIDQQAEPADNTCGEPGIPLSEATRRTLRDEGHLLFQEEG